MKARTGAVTALLTLAAAPSALAASATVDVRAEGPSRTWVETSLVNDGGSIDGGDGSGAHACDGTNGGAHPRPVPTAAHSLYQALRASRVPFRARYFASFDDFLYERIGDDAGDASGRNWLFFVNGRAPTVGGCQTRVDDGDRVTFAFTTGNEPVLEAFPEGDVVNAGEEVDVRVYEYPPSGRRAFAAGASVGGRTTDAEGIATFRFSSPGIQTMKATREGAVRSNEVRICVVERGDDSCPGFDRRPASVAVRSPREGDLRRGPALIRGAARDASGIRSVSVLLERVRGSRCQTFDRSSGRFGRLQRCGRGRGERRPARETWALRLRRRLGRGSYRVTVRVVDRARITSTERAAFRVR